MSIALMFLKYWTRIILDICENFKKKGELFSSPCIILF